MNAQAAARAILDGPKTGPVVLALIAAALGDRLNPYAYAPANLTMEDPSRSFGTPFVMVDVSGRKVPEWGCMALAAWEENGTPVVALVRCVMRRGNELFASPVDAEEAAYQPVAALRIVGVVTGCYDPDGISTVDPDPLTPEDAAEAIVTLQPGFYVPSRLLYHALGTHHHGASRPRFEGTLCVTWEFGPLIGPGDVVEFDTRDRLDVRSGFVILGALRREDGVSEVGPFLVALERTKGEGDEILERMLAFGAGGVYYDLSDVRIIGAAVARQDADGTAVSCASGIDFIDPTRPAKEHAEARKRGEAVPPVVELPELDR